MNEILSLDEAERWMSKLRLAGYPVAAVIPEFERCVQEAQPDWFLMENVPAAPLPVVAGYGVKSFLLDNSRLAGDDGGIWGHEQRRVRRFSFGMRGRSDNEVPSLKRWIDLALFVLPDALPTLTHGTGFPHDEAFKTRQVAVTSTDGGKRPSEKRRRTTAVTAGHDDANVSLTAARRERKNAVIAASSQNAGCMGSAKRQTKGGPVKGRYRYAEACRLQGLPPDFLADAPFTAEGKLRAVANGVCMHTGRAIAKAVREAIGASK